MKFRFYSASFINKVGIMQCSSSTVEFDGLKDACDFMKKGVIRQEDLGSGFIPMYCEAVE